MPGSRKRPDFLIGGHGERFYLEAVQVGTSMADLAERSRLEQAHDVLNTLPAVGFTLWMSVGRVGPRPLATKPLREALRTWLDVDVDDVAGDGTRVLAAAGGGPQDAVPNWIYVFDIADTPPTAGSPTPIEIQLVVATDAPTLSALALDVAPRNAIGDALAQDTVMTALRRRSGAYMPGIG